MLTVEKVRQILPDVLVRTMRGEVSRARVHGRLAGRATVMLRCSAKDTSRTVRDGWGVWEMGWDEVTRTVNDGIPLQLD